MELDWVNIASEASYGVAGLMGVLGFLTLFTLMSMWLSCFYILHSWRTSHKLTKGTKKPLNHFIEDPQKTIPLANLSGSSSVTESSSSSSSPTEGESDNN